LCPPSSFEQILVDSIAHGNTMARFDHLEFEHEPEQSLDQQLAPTNRDEKHWLKQAEEERRQGLYENALRYYSRGLEIDRSLIRAWVGQVQMLVFLAEYPEAELWSRKALELFHNNSELLAARAQAYCRMGDRKKAQEFCDAALKQEGESAYRW